MASSDVRIQRIEDGEVVYEQVFAKRSVDLNRELILERAETALNDNATYLGLATPTAAESVAQVAALTRQMNGLIRLVLGRLEATD